MDDLKFLIAAQQSELNAVVMYKALAEKMKNESDRELFLALAADEGKHAGILKEITQKILKPNDSLKNMTVPLYSVFGRKATFAIMAKFEKTAGKAYKGFFEKYPQTKQIAADETKHSEMLKQAISKKGTVLNRPRLCRQYKKGDLM